MHGKEVIHGDLNIGNIAIGYKNHSRIYVFGNFNFQIKKY